jgi:predicted RNA-binding Zn ribbon-like protein
LAYADYMGNVTQLAVELVNADGLDEPSELAWQFLGQHRIDPPGPGALGELPALVRAALTQLVNGAEPAAVHELLKRYPPDMHLSDHDGAGHMHVHYSRDGTEAQRWLGQLIAAQLALVAAGEQSVTLGRCAARDCGNFFVDQSRNRTRRFCSHACASRTTVAAYRARNYPA